MRLVVEEAQDHSTCMETVRQRHGADCVVVHSFRVEEKYRIVVALETEASRPALTSPSDAVRDVISPTVPVCNIKWDTFIDDVSASQPVTPSAVSQTRSDAMPNFAATPQSSPEVSSGLIALAARIKALEAAHQPTILEPETEEFRKVVFSDVLADAAVVTTTHKALADPQPPEEAPRIGGRIDGELQDLAVIPLDIPMIAVKDQGWIPSPEQTFIRAKVEDSVVPRVCTSDGAENFATLLSGCIAIASNSLPLSGQTRLKIATGQNI
jgi:hypothetical protein